jgi:hypothetical protein
MSVIDVTGSDESGQRNTTSAPASGAYGTRLTVPGMGAVRPTGLEGPDLDRDTGPSPWVLGETCGLVDQDQRSRTGPDLRDRGRDRGPDLGLVSSRVLVSVAVPDSEVLKTGRDGTGPETGPEDGETGPRPVSSRPVVIGTVALAAVVLWTGLGFYGHHVYREIHPTYKMTQVGSVEGPTWAP